MSTPFRQVKERILLFVFKFALGHNLTMSFGVGLDTREIGVK